MAKQDTKPTKEKFSLPSSSADELKKILSSYARKSGEVSLEDIARVTGINVTNVSRNSGFLTDAGLIAGGKTKTCTDLGQRLGHAFDHERSDEIKVGLTEMVQSTPFLSELLDTVRMRKGMSESDFASHILYAAGIGKDARKKAGAHAITDFLVQGGLLVSNDGNLTVGVTANNNVSSPQAAPEPEQTESPAPPAKPISPNVSTTAPVISAATTSGPFSIAINIQLELPASTDPVVYENLFKSMKKHLLSGDE
jgi:hypothetical protein